MKNTFPDLFQFWVSLEILVYIKKDYPAKRFNLIITLFFKNYFFLQLKASPVMNIHDEL